MRQVWKSGRVLALVLAVVSYGCDGGGPTAPQDDSGDTGDNPTAEEAQIGPADPPYSTSVVFPSGLELMGLVSNGNLSGSYPNVSAGVFPFDAGKHKHYQAVGSFIDVSTLSQSQRQEKVATNFSLDEYVRIPERNGDNHIYIDPQVSQHAQQLREAWGGPLNLSSTYRSPEYNDAIGASVYSRHQYGDATDILAPTKQAAQDLYNLAVFLQVDYLEPASLTVAGKNTPWIHIDDRGWAVNTPATR